MKKIIGASLLLCIPFMNQAQLNNFLNRAKSKVEARINTRADQAIDKALDEAEGKNTPAPKENKPERTQAAPPAAPAAAAVETVEKPTIKSYSKFDFVPGDQIIYTEDFAQDAVGELPTNW